MERTINDQHKLHLSVFIYNDLSFAKSFAIMKLKVNVSGDIRYWRVDTVGQMANQNLPSQKILSNNMPIQFKYRNVPVNNGTQL